MQHAAERGEVQSLDLSKFAGSGGDGGVILPLRGGSRVSLWARGRFDAARLRRELG